MNSAIYSGAVSHHRLQPKRHGFNYTLFMMYLDLDELPDIFQAFLFWSSRRPALAWFRRQDHIGDGDISLRESVCAIIHSKTGKQQRGPIRLLTHLRYFGYCMNPVSFYYCWDETDNKLDYIVAEVHNTPWAETHCYVLDYQAADINGETFKFTFDKAFHVSPFMGMRQQYEWYLSAPGKELMVNMNSYEDGVKVFNAAMQLHRNPITHLSMAKILTVFPFMTAKVVTAIYWQALLLWLRKIPFYNHPKNMKQELNT